MQYNFTEMPNDMLVDLLAQETEKFSQLMAEKRFSDEYYESKNIILQLQAVIESRKQQTMSEQSLTYTPPDTTL